MEDIQIKAENKGKLKSDDIEKQIIEGLNSLVQNIKDEHWDSNGYWTKIIKEKLYDLAKNQNQDLLVAASGLEKADWGEWLFDMIWYKYENSSLKDVYLVVESEWNLDEENIQLDFEKLLIAKSRYRLLIFQALTEEKAVEIIENFNKIVENCSQSVKGDRYLYAAYIINKEIFYPHIKIKSSIIDLIPIQKIFVSLKKLCTIFFR